MNAWNRATVGVVLFGATTVLSAADLGSPDLLPTAERPIGWRSDGSGRYPAATPTISFERSAITPLSKMVSQAKKPAGAELSGKPLSRFTGEFRATEWLVLGPLDPPNAAKPLDGEPIAGEASLAPDEGDAGGALKWRRVESSGGVDFGAVFGEKPAGKIAYAVMYFYSEEAFKCAMIWRGRDMKQWLNDKPSNGWERAKQEIRKGWNRIVVKMVAPANQDAWEFKHSFFPHSEEGVQYKETNIRWARPMPASSWSMPVIAGERIFLTSDPNDLICMNKSDGSLRWVRSNPVWYAAIGSEQEKSACIDIVRHTKSTLTLISSKPLSKESVTPESFAIEKSPVSKIEFSTDLRTIRLTAAEPWTWKRDNRVLIKYSGLKTTSGEPMSGEVELWTNRSAEKIYGLDLEPESSAVADENSAASYLEELRPKIAELEKLNEACVTTTVWAKDEPRRKLSLSITDAVRKNDRSFRVSIGWGGGNTGPTPVTDGQRVYAWFGETGVLSCFDLDGKRLWTRFEKPGGGEHGINASPVLSGNLLVLIAGGHWAAFDKLSGKPAWQQKYAHPCYGTPVVTKIGDVPVLVAPDGQVLRAADGEVISPSVDKFDGECASAVIDGNRFFLFARAGFCVAELPAKAEKGAGVRIIRKLDPKAVDPLREPYPVGSPVFHDGILYAVRSGWGAGNHDPMIYAFEAESTEPIYRQKLDLEPAIFYGPEGGGVCASLCFAGGNIFVLDNRGTWIIFKPGREFKQVARTQVEHWTSTGAREVTGNTPVFEGKLMYVRAREMFYCIGEK
jgi:outer membrane protein assembly factor BamB